MRSRGLQVDERPAFGYHPPAPEEDDVSVGWKMKLRRPTAGRFRDAAARLVGFAFVLGLIPWGCRQAAPTQPDIPPDPPPPPAVTEIYVDAVNGDDASGSGTASSPYRTIGMGLRSSSPGMSVILRPGLYNAALGESFPIRLKENVALVGAGADGVTVDGSGADYVLEDASQARAEKLTVRGGRLAGVLLRNGSSLVRCVLRSNFRGVLCTASAAIEENVVEDNADTGIYIGGSASPSIRNNAIRRNGGEGVECVDSSTPVLRGNEISDNRKHGLVCTDAAAPVLEGNTVTRNVLPEVYVLFDARPTLTGNVIRDNERYNIDDARSPNRGQLSAVGNTWNDPQPAGTVFGPADSRPNYFIKESGNSLKFSEGSAVPARRRVP